jgi:hypothetical protein
MADLHSLHTYKSSGGGDVGGSSHGTKEGTTGHSRLSHLSESPSESLGGSLTPALYRSCDAKKPGRAVGCSIAIGTRLLRRFDIRLALTEGYW